MATIDGGEMVARILEREGIREIFTLPGDVDLILRAAESRGFRIIDTRHEQAAGHMADGWARVTGRPGVAAVTSGPGVTDVVTAVANAYADAIPMLVLAGRSAIVEDETVAQQSLPQVEMMRPITKWAYTVPRPQRIAEFTAMALRQATTGRPGPVFLDIPDDVMKAQVEEERVFFPEEYRPKAPPAAQTEAIAKAMDALESAQRPVILAGGGVWFAQAADELREFAALTQIPVLANGKARGCVPEDTPLGFGDFVPLAAGQPDVVLVLGARLGLFTGGRYLSLIPASAKVIQVDIEGEEIGRNRDVQLGIVGDCREVLRQLLEGARQHPWPQRDAWLEVLGRTRQGRSQAFAAGLASSEPPIHPFRLATEVARFLPDDAIIAADGGEAWDWMNSAAVVKRPGHWLSHGYLGCLGVGLSFGMAAKLAHPNKPVLVTTGDGSIGLNFAEFHTAAKHNLPVVVVVFNDKAWGMCKHGQEMARGKGQTVATELGLVHYEKAAEGLGAYGELVEKPADIVPALKRAFKSGKPACLNVLIDPDAVSPATIGGAAMSSAIMAAAT
ncbi:MAG: thiamine pyrophosphate-binding protein [Dehalococcoidia bacterium]|nr:MAG: thiamine pyrophosphate-binding protein [Dehalococcoidia bacterium]